MLLDGWPGKHIFQATMKVGRADHFIKYILNKVQFMFISAYEEPVPQTNDTVFPTLTTVSTLEGMLTCLA
jgi:hypothetical protein